MNRLALIVSLLLLAGLAGCDRETPASRDTARPRDEAVGSARPAPVAGGTDDTLLAIELLPGVLTTTSPVRVRVRGCRETLTYAWRINGRPVDDADGNRLDPATFRAGDTVSVEVSCGGRTLTRTAKVRNTPPKIVAVSFQSPEISPGQPITVVPEAVDPDDDPIAFSYRWTVNGRELVGLDSPTLPGAYVVKGNEIDVDITPRDLEASGPTYSGDSFIIPNSPPAFTSSPPGTFNPEGYHYQVTARDPDDDPLTFSLEEAPEGMTIDSRTGIVTWPRAALTIGRHKVAISVTDTDGASARQEFILTLSSME